MEKLKIRVLGIFAIFAVLIGMAGIVNAAPSCGGNAVFDPVGIGSVGTSTSGTVVTYNVAASGTIIGLCVEETDKSNLAPFLSTFDLRWTAKPFDHHNYFSFERNSGQLELMSGQNDDVGKGDFGSVGNLPTKEIYALHVSDAPLCTKLSGSSKSTCWIAPGSGIPPVPELSAIVLMISGLFGLVLVTRKYKSK